MNALLGTGLAVGLLWLLRRLIHRSLAPDRIPEQRTPADVGLVFREVCFPTANGKNLFGWFVPAPDDGRAPAVAIIHGWGGNAETMLPLAKPLHEAGFAVLLFDARCHGRSDEDTFASLPRFAEDVEHAVAWLHELEKVDPDRIALVGHSVGAGAALLAASRRKGIAAVVSLAAFSHPVAMMKRWLGAKGIPFVPVGWLLMRYVEWVIGHRFDDIAPVHTIRRVRCPALLIHGEKDETVPVSEAEAIHAARSGNHVELRVVAGSHDDYGDLAREVPALVAFLVKRVNRTAVTSAAPTSSGSNSVSQRLGDSGRPTA